MKKVVAVLGTVALTLLITTGAFAANKMLTGSDIKNGSIGAVDLSKSAKAALKGQTGEKGATGEKGDVGAMGAPGKNGAPGGAGPTGPAGPQGAPGTPGERGPQGAEGPAGRSPVTVDFTEGFAALGQADSWFDVTQTSVSTNGAGRLLVEFSASTQCVGGPAGCPLRVLVDGQEVGRTVVPSAPSEYRTFSAVTAAALSSGSHTVKVEMYTQNGVAVFIQDRLVKTTAL